MFTKMFVPHNDSKNVHNMTDGRLQTLETDRFVRKVATRVYIDEKNNRIFGWGGANLSNTVAGREKNWSTHILD